MQKEECLEIPCFIFYKNLSRVLLQRPLGAKCIRLKEKLFLKANWRRLCFYQWKAFVFVPKVICIQNQGNCANLQRHFSIIHRFYIHTYIHTYTYMDLINQYNILRKIWKGNTSFSPEWDTDFLQLRKTFYHSTNALIPKPDYIRWSG